MLGKLTSLYAEGGCLLCGQERRRSLQERVLELESIVERELRRRHQAELQSAQKNIPSPIREEAMQVMQHEIDSKNKQVDSFLYINFCSLFIWYCSFNEILENRYNTVAARSHLIHWHLTGPFGPGSTW